MSIIVKNQFDDITANERIYFRFIKKLSYIFRELGQIEQTYSERISRLLQFLKRNENGIEKFPINNLRKKLEEHFEKIAIAHQELSQKCKTDLYEPVFKRIENDITSKKVFEKKKEEIEGSFEQTKKTFEEYQKQYYEATEKVAINYIELKKNSNLEINKELEKSALNAQNIVLDYVQKQLNERNIKIKEYQEEVKKYKENNATSIKILDEVLHNYLSIYKKNYDDSSTLMSTLINSLPQLKNEDYEKMYEDTSELTNYAKLEFIPFTSGHDYFLLKQCQDKGIKDETVIKQIKSELIVKFGSEIPEFHDNDKTVQENYRSIQNIVEKLIKGEYDTETIKQEEVYNNIISEYKYSLFFLRILNKNRSKLINIKQNVYKCFEGMMKDILEKLHSKGSEENRELFFETIEYIIILSQTFYTNQMVQETERRTLLQDEISQEKIWKTSKIWIDMINYHIEIDKIEQNVNTEKDYDIRQIKIKTIVLPALTTFMFNMQSFLVGSDISKEVLDYFQTKYELTKHEIEEISNI